MWTSATWWAGVRRGVVYDVVPGGHDSPATMVGGGGLGTLAAEGGVRGFCRWRPSTWRGSWGWRSWSRRSGRYLQWFSARVSECLHFGVSIFLLGFGMQINAMQTRDEVLNLCLRFGMRFIVVGAKTSVAKSITTLG